MKNKIHIKESKKGTFTEAAKARGMGVQTFASKVLSNKDNYTPAMVKKANFAKNASKWKHADGGLLPKLPDGGRLMGESWEQYMRRRHKEEKDHQYTLSKAKKRDPNQPAWFDYDNAMSYDDRDELKYIKDRAYMLLRNMNSHGWVNYEENSKSQFDALARKYKQIAAPYAGELLEQEGLPRAIGRYEDTYKNLEKRITPLEAKAMSVEKHGSYGTVKEIDGYGRLRSDGRTRIYEKPAIEKRPTADQFATDKLGHPVSIPEVRKGVPRDMSISYGSIFENGGMLNGIGQGILSGIGNAILPGIGGMLLPQLGNMLTKGKNPFKLYNDGGYLIQYSGPKHEKGGILVNQNGKRDDVNPVAEVEGGESGLKTKSGVYVFSDHLINPASGNTFSKDAKRINSKYKGTDRMAVNARKNEYAKLQQLNEQSRFGNSTVMREGGEIDPYIPNNDKEVTLGKQVRFNNELNYDVNPARSATNTSPKKSPATQVDDPWEYAMENGKYFTRKKNSDKWIDLGTANQTEGISERNQKARAAIIAMYGDKLKSLSPPKQAPGSVDKIRRDNTEVVNGPSLQKLGNKAFPNFDPYEWRRHPQAIEPTSNPLEGLLFGVPKMLGSLGKLGIKTAMKSGLKTFGKEGESLLTEAGKKAIVKGGVKKGSTELIRKGPTGLIKKGPNLKTYKISGELDSGIKTLNEGKKVLTSGAKQLGSGVKSQMDIIGKKGDILKTVYGYKNGGQLPKFDPGGKLPWEQKLQFNINAGNPLMGKMNVNQMLERVDSPYLNQPMSLLPTLTGRNNAGLFSSTSLPFNKDGKLTSIGNNGSIDVTVGRSNPLNQSTIGGLMKAGAYGMNLLDALRKPERENLQLADFGKGNKLVQGTGMSMEPMRQEINMQANKALDMAKSASGSFGQYMSRANSILGQSGKSLAESQMAQKQYNDQIALTKAGRQDQLSQLNQVERIRKQNADSANVAMKQDAVANFYTNLNNLGTEFQKQDYLKNELANLNQKQKQDFMVKLATANAINPNFQIDKEALTTALREDNLEGIMKAITFVKRNGGLIPKLK